MIFLAHTSAASAAVTAAGLGDDVLELAPGLLAIDAPLTRSQLYHRLKALQPADEALLVAALEEVPKFKGMAEGSLRWFRDHLC